MSDLSFANKPTDFYPYVKHVIDWNGIKLSGKHDFSQKNKDLQKKFVQEEYTELMTLGFEAQNKVEVMDGLADLVVTAGYWMYLKDPHIISSSCKLLTYSFGTNYAKNIQYAINKDDPWEVLQGVMALCHQVDFKVGEAIREVLRSNDSKMPSIDDYKAYHGVGDAELGETLVMESKTLNSKFEGRYEGIYATESVGHIVFRDKEGKIIKPLMYSEPDLKLFV